MRIIKRCCFCPVKHRMDNQGNPIPGNATQSGVVYSDGLCKIAEKIENAKLDAYIRKEIIK